MLGSDQVSAMHNNSLLSAVFFGADNGRHGITRVGREKGHLCTAASRVEVLLRNKPLRNQFKCSLCRAFPFPRVSLHTPTLPKT